MSYIVKIPRTEVDEVRECAEAIMNYGSKMMKCIEKMQDSEVSERMGHRMGYREQEDYLYPMGERNRMGYREDEESEYPMGERRGRNSMGRYTSR